MKKKIKKNAKLKKLKKPEKPKKNSSKKEVKKPFRIFVISGPGGAGKTTLVNELFQNKHLKNNCTKAITVTTREMRPQEVEGKDYYFVDKGEFAYLNKKNFFIENEKIADNYYGTPKLFLNFAKKLKKDLALCIDVKGGMYLKKNLKADKIVTIFITVPNEKDLLRRMKKREDEPAAVKKRFDLAKEEMKYAKKYDHIIINRTLKKALKETEAIIKNSS